MWKRAVRVGWLLAGTSVAAAGAATRPVLVVRPGWVVEVETGERHAGWALRSEGDRIAAIGPASTVAVPPGARVV